MRWESLFAALDAEFEAAEAAEFAAEVEDRTRRELARIRLVDRLRATTDRLSISLRDGSTTAGRLVAVGPDWMLVSESPARDTLIPAAAVMGVEGLGRAAEAREQESPVQARLDLRYALRLLAQNRSVVTVSLNDGRSVVGTIDRVGADWVDLVEHRDLEGRRHGAGRAVRTVPFGALTVLRSG